MHNPILIDLKLSAVDNIVSYLNTTFSTRRGVKWLKADDVIMERPEPSDNHDFNTKLPAKINFGDLLGPDEVVFYYNRQTLDDVMSNKAVTASRGISPKDLRDLICAQYKLLPTEIRIEGWTRGVPAPKVRIESIRSSLIYRPSTLDIPMKWSANRTGT